MWGRGLPIRTALADMVGGSVPMNLQIGLRCLALNARGRGERVLGARGPHPEALEEPFAPSF